MVDRLGYQSEDLSGYEAAGADATSSTTVKNHVKIVDIAAPA